MMLPRLDLSPLVLMLALLAGLRAAAQPVPEVSIGYNFTSSRFGTDASGTPADCNGVIGAGYFVELINGTFAVYSATNGQFLKRIDDGSFWANAGVVLASSQAVTDPRVVYDPASHRWFASMIAFDGGALDPATESNDFLLAVSNTSDPRGAWHGFRFQADPDTGTFADFPTLGIDANAVYLSGDNRHDVTAGVDNPLGCSLWSFPKADLLNSNLANATWFGVMDYSQRGMVLQPANCFDGSVTGKILATSDIGLDSSPHSNLVCFAVQNAGGPGATLTASTFIPTLPWEVPDNPYLGAPCFGLIQPDGTDTLQGNDARISAKVYAVGGVLYAVHNTFLNNHVAIRWYRVRAADNTLLESGTIADPDLDLSFPSIAANPAGVVMIAFNACGSGLKIGWYVMPGQTVNGVTTFGDRILLQFSTVNYHDLYEQVGLAETSRWGDFSTLSVDPANPNQFWAIGMYALPDPNYDTIWATQITQLLTLPQPLVAIQGAPSTVTLSWPSAFSNYQLQSSSNLLSALSWTNVSQGPVTNGLELVVNLPRTAGPQFFRLKKL